MRFMSSADPPVDRVLVVLVRFRYESLCPSCRVCLWFRTGRCWTTTSWTVVLTGPGAAPLLSVRVRLDLTFNLWPLTPLFKTLRLWLKLKLVFFLIVLNASFVDFSSNGQICVFVEHLQVQILFRIILKKMLTLIYRTGSGPRSSSVLIR